MKAFVIRWLITAAAVLAAVGLMPGIRCDGTAALLGTALLLGIINAFVRPVLMLLSLPFIVVTMGFFILVINALILRFVGGLVPGFHVAGFWSAFFGAILISLVSWILSALFRGSDGQVHVITRPGQLKQAQGRVIE